MVLQELGGAKLLSRINPAFIRNGVVDRRAMYAQFVDNGTLPEDATRQIDEALTRVARRDLRAVADLRNAGLTVGLRDIGVTSFEFDRITPVGPAKQGMSIAALGDADLVTFTKTAIPVPVTSSSFQLDARTLAGGGRGATVSVTNVEESTRAVAEKLEDTLVNGSSVILGGNTLPGYVNFGSRIAVTLGTAWSSLSPGSMDQAISDVLAMRAAARNSGFSGPYVLYIPSNWDGVMGEDYKANSDRTVQERILAIDGISDVRVLPSLPDDNALLVQLTSSVVQAAIGQDISTISWDSKGGLVTDWAILAVMTFALKAAVAREPLSAGVLPAATTASGIVHLS